MFERRIRFTLTALLVLFASTSCEVQTDEDGCLAPVACCLANMDLGCVEVGRTEACETLGGVPFEGLVCAQLTEEQCPLGQGILGACCVTDSLGVSTCLDDVSLDGCSDLGGVFSEAVTCDQVPEGACGINVGGACCLTLGDSALGMRCVDVQQESACTEMDGQFTPLVGCDQLDEESCPALPAPTGACCIASAGSCVSHMTEEGCSEQGGEFFLGLTCSELDGDECSYAEKGACCDPKISYVNVTGVWSVSCLDNLTPYKCKILQGTHHAGKGCDELTAEGTCTPTGACCMGDGNCQSNTIEEECVGKGTFFPAQDCEHVDCPEVGGACCIPGSSYAVCADSTTSLSCSEAGGTYFINRDCIDLSTSECPVVQTGSCCHPKISYVNEEGVTPVRCLDKLTEYKCKILQGQWSYNDTCAEVGEEGLCPAYGACCYEDDGIKKCANWMLEVDCKKLTAGVFSPDLKCDQVECQPRGACCHPDDTEVIDGIVTKIPCIDALRQSECEGKNGQWTEDATCEEQATEGTCLPQGACCQSDGNCFEAESEEQCIGETGSFHANRLCDGLGCVPATGACCHPKISYVNEEGVTPVRCLTSLTEYKCKILQGQWTMGLTCDDLADQELCPPYGACCYEADGIKKCANWMLEADCMKLTGAVFNAELRCDQAPCIPRGACCHPGYTQTVGDTLQLVPCSDDNTLTQCDAKDGTWFEAQTCEAIEADGTCLPAGACCRSDGTCLDGAFEAECVADNGTFTANALCPGVTCIAKTGACCHPKISYVNENGVFPVQCLDNMTQYKCTILQGTWSMETTCLDLDSNGMCAPFGACCYSSDGQRKCANWLLESSCSSLENSTFHADLQCAEVDCTLEGACCLYQSGTPTGCVESYEEATCLTMGGTFYPLLGCDDIPDGMCEVPELGACCMPYGDCGEMYPRSECEMYGGVFHHNYTCKDVPGGCPTTGACCVPGIACVDEVTQMDCTQTNSQAGFLLGRTCAELSDKECPFKGACCTPEEGCENGFDYDSCTAISGTYFDGVNCDKVSPKDCPHQDTARGACCNPELTMDGGWATVWVHCMNNQSYKRCYFLDGTWTPGVGCEETDPPCPWLGACCEGTGKCTDRTRYEDCFSPTYQMFHFPSQLCADIMDQCIPY